MVSGVSGVGAFLSAALARTQGSNSQTGLNQQDLLAKLDKSGDGSIDKTELKSFLDYVSSSTGSDSSIDSDALFTSLDADGDGKLSTQEMSDGVKTLFDVLRDQLRSAKLAPPAPREGGPDPEEMFASIDTDQDGSISKAELSAFIEAHPAEAGSPNAPGVEEILARDDANDDGAISLSEFKTAFEKRLPDGPRNADAGSLALLAALIDQYVNASSDGSTSASQLNATA